MKPRIFFECPTCSILSPSWSHLTTMSSGGDLPDPGAKGSGRLTIASCLPLGPSPKFVTFHTRFLSQVPPALSAFWKPPAGMGPWGSSSRCAGCTGCCGCAGCCGCSCSCAAAGCSCSSCQGSKNLGPPCAEASQVTQPDLEMLACPNAASPVAEPSKITGILMMPPESTCCGPLCSTTAPQTSTATSSLSREMLSRTTMSPLLEPLEKTIFQRGVFTFSRYFGPPTAEASTVAQPRGCTGMRCSPVAWPLTKTSQGPACKT
mmetsp:Transcript_57320/g.114854  ORF Transcript_57320/g.114854 Transcript_57320/m.114854 type:complete len:262 (-) Transcript_57320:478-1263(-)